MSDSSERVTCRHMLMYDSDDSFSDPDEAIDNYYEMLAAYDNNEETSISDIDTEELKKMEIIPTYKGNLSSLFDDSENDDSEIESITIRKINESKENPDPNIFDYNNSFEYSLDGGNTWILYEYPLGCYNIDYLTSILKEDINIDDIQFVGCAEEQRVDLILNNNAQVRFIPTSKFNEVIGFDNGTYTQSTRGRRYPNF